MSPWLEQAPGEEPVDEGGRRAAPAELDTIEARVTAWFESQLGQHPVLDAVERGEPGERRWYVRMRGEDKDFSTIWFTLRQRSLHFECYVIPAPEEQHEAFYEYFLRRNHRTYGMAYAIGDEDAVFLVGQVPLGSLDGAVLDRVVGSVWQYVEESFRPALRIGYASRLAAAKK